MPVVVATSGIKLSIWKEKTYAEIGKRNGYNVLSSMLCDWKRNPETSFLAEVNAQILQQSLKDLERAHVNFFQKRANPPKFKKKGSNESFRYPQGFKLDQVNSRAYFPKIGWIRYRNSRYVPGTLKQMIFKLYAGKWFVCITTEREVDMPAHPSDTSIGIDMGVAHFAVFSDGTMRDAPNSFRKYEKKLAKAQRRLSRKTKFSSNWHKAKAQVQRIHRKIAAVRNDFLHKATTFVSKNHAVVVMEDLKVRNMSASASGSMERPGRNVRAKSGLNKRILDQGWYEFRRQLEYKLDWNGGRLVVVNPRYTSQTCHVCGNIDGTNRISQSRFVCTKCGHENNADVNAALNILAAGQAVSACGAERVRASAVKQEPSRIAV